MSVRTVHRIKEGYILFYSSVDVNVPMEHRHDYRANYGTPIIRSTRQMTAAMWPPASAFLGVFGHYDAGATSYPPLMNYPKNIYVWRVTINSPMATTIISPSVCQLLQLRGLQPSEGKVCAIPSIAEHGCSPSLGVTCIGTLVRKSMMDV